MATSSEKEWVIHIKGRYVVVAVLAIGLGVVYRLAVEGLNDKVRTLMVVGYLMAYTIGTIVGYGTRRSAEED